METKKEKKLLFCLSGGGTGGSVSPLLAAADAISERVGPRAEFFFIGTHAGPEKGMVGSRQIRFYPINAGKLRRYPDLRNLTDILNIIRGYFQSLAIFIRQRPDIVLTAGSYVSVPVAYAAWTLRIPVMAHQQDLRPGLANRLIAPLAARITTVFEKSVRDFGGKAVWTGNPVRQEFYAARAKSQDEKSRQTKRRFGLDGSQPVVLAIGGGTGALFINQLVADCREALLKSCQLIHVTGANKASREIQEQRPPNYHPYEFLGAEDVAAAIAAADLVVSRCGIGFLSELAFFSKSVILIPMPDTHQEDNALYFVSAGAAVMLDQRTARARDLLGKVRELIADATKRESLARAMRKMQPEDVNVRFVDAVLACVNHPARHP